MGSGVSAAVPDNGPRARIKIVVHSLDHAMAAAASAVSFDRPLTLLSVAGGGLSLGVGWFAALGDLVRERYPQLDVTLFIDCADAAGTAMGALRRGLNVVFAGHDKAFMRLNAIASQSGLIVTRSVVPDLDLLNAHDASAACQKVFTQQVVAA